MDNSAANGENYYYVVAAADTSSDVSGYSNQDSALPPDLTDDDIIDLKDLVEVASQWLTTYDLDDLSVIAENWLVH